MHHIKAVAQAIRAIRSKAVDMENGINHQAGDLGYGHMPRLSLRYASCICGELPS